MPPVLVLVLVLNAGSFLLFGWDKLCALRGWRRVPETRLCLAALAFGAAGAWLGVLVFRHKVSKPRFLALLALATLGCAALAVGAWRLFGPGA